MAANIDDSDKISNSAPVASEQKSKPTEKWYNSQAVITAITIILTASLTAIATFISTRHLTMHEARVSESQELIKNIIDIRIEAYKALPNTLNNGELPKSLTREDIPIAIDTSGISDTWKPAQDALIEYAAYLKQVENIADDYISENEKEHYRKMYIIATDMLWYLFDPRSTKDDSLDLVRLPEWYQIQKQLILRDTTHEESVKEEELIKEYHESLN